MRTARLKNFIEINPTVRLAKAVEYPFVPMDAITPGRRYVEAPAVRVAGGGAKFCGGDTLFARITPCLENGKIAQFKAAATQAAFGSTEYWVFRAIENVSDPAYVFYLATSEIIRGPAEKSMSGASGRQRADIASVADLEVPAPDLSTQRHIASILSAYDNLIENNTRRISILEEMARRIYEEWFIHFRFPGHEQVKMVESDLGLIPEGWSVSKVAEVVHRLPAGQTYKKENVSEEGRVMVVDQSALDYLGFHDLDIDHPASVDTPRIIFGDHTCKLKLMLRPFSVGPNTIPLFGADGLDTIYLFQLVQGLVQTREYKRHWTDFSDKHVLLCPKELASEYGKAVREILGLGMTLDKKNRNLRATRDLLLPRLISGELDVSTLPEPEEAVAA